MARWQRVSSNGVLMRLISPIPRLNEPIKKFIKRSIAWPFDLQHNYLIVKNLRAFSQEFLGLESKGEERPFETIYFRLVRSRSPLDILSMTGLCFSLLARFVIWSGSFCTPKRTDFQFSVGRSFCTWCISPLTEIRLS